MTQKNIGIITFPINKAGTIPLSNLVDVMSSISENIYLITGNDGYLQFVDNSKVNLYGMNHESKNTILKRIYNYIVVQVKISRIVYKIRHKVNIFIFFIGGESLILPMLCSKLLNKKVILAPVDYSINFGTGISRKILKNIIKVNRFYSNKIVVHSSVLIKEWDLTDYSNKIYVAHEYFLDTNQFTIKKAFNQRKNLIGYIGRFTEEKGVLNFIQAIPKILTEKNDFEFMICGDGPLLEEIEQYLLINNLTDKIKMTGWISHNKLPEYINNLKLLVIPSYNESGPIIALESMACGTPIVAPRVGHILNLIADGENGFIMEDNSPESIYKNTIRALNDKNIDDVINNGRNFVEQEFNYNVAVDGYKKVLDI